MRAWFGQLDELLRGKKTGPEALANGSRELRLRIFAPFAIALGATYGLFMGLFAVLNRTPPNYLQILASMVKLPALFLLTLAVTFPSLYVFNTLLGCRLTFSATLRLLLAAVVVNLALAASFGTILGFFTLSTTSYPFMIVLNVALLAVAGMVALGFLLRALQRLAQWQSIEPADANSGAPGAPTALGVDARDAVGPANAIFRVWVLIYALVGAQMGWLLRPFIGSPHHPFEWFRPRSGNFFLAVYQSLQTLFSQ